MVSVPSLADIFFMFLKLGSLGFGGPLALIALMEKECAQKKQWVSVGAFSETFLLCKLLPGPVAFQMAVWVGYQTRGRLGGLVTGFAFLLPGLCLMLLLSIFYGYVTQLSFFHRMMEGFRIGALVLIAESLLRMFAPYLRRWPAWAIGILAAVGFWAFPRWEPVWILAGGFGWWGGRRLWSSRRVLAVSFPVLLELFWVHFKGGAFVFGTGLAVVPFLESEVVKVRGWLTPEAFLDGIAFGQLTPGPVTLASAFIGFRVGQFPGAFSAVAGMYTPGLLLMLAIVPWLRKKMIGSEWLKDFKDGALPAVMGCLFFSVISLGRDALSSGSAFAIFLVCAFVLWKQWLPGWLLMPIAAGLDYFFELFVRFLS